MLLYNIHASINIKSHKKGLVSDGYLLRLQMEIQKYITERSWLEELNSSKHPRSTYGIYYPRVYGKAHSQYKKRWK